MANAGIRCNHVGVDNGADEPRQALFFAWKVFELKYALTGLISVIKSICSFCSKSQLIANDEPPDIIAPWPTLAPRPTKVQTDTRSRSMNLQILQASGALVGMLSAESRGTA